eukprot:359555-Chlamydomonas_euryale.AAC.2
MKGANRAPAVLRTSPCRRLLPGVARNVTGLPKSLSGSPGCSSLASSLPPCQQVLQSSSHGAVVGETVKVIGAEQPLQLEGLWPVHCLPRVQSLLEAAGRNLLCQCTATDWKLRYAHERRQAAVRTWRPLDDGCGPSAHTKTCLQCVCSPIPTSTGKCQSLRLKLPYPH